MQKKENTGRESFYRKKRKQYRRKVRWIKRGIWGISLICMVCVSIEVIGSVQDQKKQWHEEKNWKEDSTEEVLSEEEHTLSKETIAGEERGFPEEIVSEREPEFWEERVSEGKSGFSGDENLPAKEKYTLEENGYWLEEQGYPPEEWKIGAAGEVLTEAAGYPAELLEMLEKYPQTYEFVAGYPQRSRYMGQEIDLSKEAESEEVPLLLQWDRRWGYDSYGDEMIGSSGCGPTCMSMAYIYLTGNTDMNPRVMAEFAEENGYNAQAGTKWSFWTEGAGQLGLIGNKLGLSETAMKETLDSGKLIICSMRPGDFTKGGHFILIRGYNENGFWVNDPNSKENSQKQWKFDEISWQIKNLWSIGM